MIVLVSLYEYPMLFLLCCWIIANVLIVFSSRWIRSW